MSESPVQEWRIRVCSESTDATYVIDVVKVSKTIKLACSCQAGILGKLCKHVIAVVSGDSSGMIQPNQETEVRAICEAFRCSEGYSLLVEYRRTQAGKDALEKKLKELKKVLSKALLG